MQAVRECRLTPHTRTSKSILIESESVAFVSDESSISPQINLHPVAPLLAPAFWLAAQDRPLALHQCLMTGMRLDIFLNNVSVRIYCLLFNTYDQGVFLC